MNLMGTRGNLISCLSCLRLSLQFTAANGTNAVECYVEGKSCTKNTLQFRREPPKTRESLRELSHLLATDFQEIGQGAWLGTKICQKPASTPKRS